MKRWSLLAVVAVCALHADELEIPKTTRDKTKNMPLYEPVMRDEADRKEEDFDKTLDQIIHGDEKTLEKHAEVFARQPKTFTAFLQTLPEKLRGRERRFSQIVWRQLRAPFRDEIFQTPGITLSLRDATLTDALALLTRMANVNFVIAANVQSRIGQLTLFNVTLGQALAAILAQTEPELALIKEGDAVYRVVPFDRAAELLAGRLEESGSDFFVTHNVTITHQKLTESLKTRLEKMWHGVTNGASDKAGYYLAIDDASKKVFFRGTEEQVRDFSNFLHEIDIAVPQVKIEGRVVIANKDFEYSFGLQWSSLFNRRAGVSRGVNFIGSGPLADINNNPQQQSSASLTDWALNLFPAVAEVTRKIKIPFVLGGSDLNTKRLNLVLNAAENKSEIKTILKPSLYTNHDEEAEILVGERIPIEVVVKETIEGSLRDISTVNYKDVGTKLKVKPTVSPDKQFIFLDVYVESSVTKRNEAQPKFPIITTTRSHNRVILRSGETTLIGGLLEDNREKNKTALPGLSKIPILGHLFRGSRKFIEDKQLMIFITPTVV